MVKKKKSKLTDAQRRDLDETRRLLYMVKCMPGTEHYEIAGTLINAMRHHQGVTDPDLEDNIIGALNAGKRAPWLRTALERLT